MGLLRSRMHQSSSQTPTPAAIAEAWMSGCGAHGVCISASAAMVFICPPPPLLLLLPFLQLAALHYSSGEVSGLPIRTAFLIDPVDNTK
jgi:hypothetical protein